jgi:hypothetical protein
LLMSSSPHVAHVCFTGCLWTTVATRCGCSCLFHRLSPDCYHCFLWPVLLRSKPLTVLYILSTLSSRFSHVPHIFGSMSRPSIVGTPAVGFVHSWDSFSHHHSCNRCYAVVRFVHFNSCRSLYAAYSCWSLLRLPYILVFSTEAPSLVCTGVPSSMQCLLFVAGALCSFPLVWILSLDPFCT